VVNRIDVVLGAERVVESADVLREVQDRLARGVETRPVVVWRLERFDELAWSPN